MTTRDELVGHIADQKRRYQTVSLSHEQADALVRLASRQEVSVEELARSILDAQPEHSPDIARALLAEYSITKRS